MNCNDQRGLNAIYCAAGHEEGSLLIELLQRGATPNLPTAAGWTALGLASARGSLGNIESLLDFGANLEWRDPRGAIPFLMAIDHGQLQACNFLLDKGARIDATLNFGAGVLQIANAQRLVDILSALLACGAKVEVSGNLGSTLLLEASLNGFEFGIDKLIEHYDKLPRFIDAPSLIYGRPLYAAANEGLKMIVRRLLDTDA